MSISGANSPAIVPLPIALILAGGASRRFGSDKLIHPIAGIPMLDRVISACTDAGLELWLSGRPPPPGNTCGWIPDPMASAGSGPMAGLLAGLEQLQQPVLLLAGDMPLITAEDLTWLCAQGRGTHGVMPHSDHGFEPCFAIYSPQMAPIIRQALENGERRLRSLATFGDFTHPQVPAAIAHRLINCNTLAQAQTIVEEPKS